MTNRKQGGQRKSETRAFRIQVPVTRGERAALEAAARVDGLPLAAWIRNVVVRRARRVGK